MCKTTEGRTECREQGLAQCGAAVNHGHVGSMRHISIFPKKAEPWDFHEKSSFKKLVANSTSLTKRLALET